MKVKVLLVVLLALLVAVSALAVTVVKPRPMDGPRVGGPRDGVRPPAGNVRSPQWWEPAPNQTPTVQGKVTNVGQDTITLSLDRGLQTFAVTERTEIMVEGKKGALGDIRQGDPCILRMQIVPRGFPIALAIRARQPEGPPPVKAQGVAGIVAEVAPDHIVINAPKGPLGFVVNAETQVFVFGRKASMGDVKVGAQAEVAFRGADGAAPVALRINVLRPRFEGLVTEVNGNVLTLKAKDRVFTVTVAPDAKIRFRERPATLADIKVGCHVVAFGDANGNNMTAVEVQVMPAMRKGVVTAINGNEITIATVEQVIITGQLNERTIVTVRPRIGPNRPGSAADIKVESPVDVGGNMLDGGPYQGGTMQLLFVDVFVAQ